MKQQRARNESREQGFTLVEMSIAAALALVIMAVAMLGVVEAQRSITTSVARNSDANAAQATFDEIGTAVRSGGTNSTVAVDSTGTQLWIYDPNGVPSGNASKPFSTCVVWDYSGGTLSRTTGGAGTALPAGGVEVQGAGQYNGTAVFQAVSGTHYPGLLDIDLTVQHATKASSGSVQEESSASRLETQVLDPVSAIQAATTDVPNANCYP
jgi:prepilin-type N-terminal cleavage/methylation domain-containing protein